MSETCHDAQVHVRYQAELFPAPSVDGGGDGLSDGETYEVIEVSTDAERTSLRIVSDDGTPALFDARGFVTVDDTLPGDWRLEITEHVTTLGPAHFLTPGFWEAYFDREPNAVEVFKRRHSQAAWTQLTNRECDLLWRDFETRYTFRAGTTSTSWPAIREPMESVTFDLAPLFDNEGPTFAAGADAINAEALRAFVSVFHDEDLFALDWQHPAYRFRPDRWALSSDPEWNIPVFPNGDYYAFFNDDFTSGTFGHPWEQSLCVIGEPLIESLGASLATWLPVLRRGERGGWRDRG